jgi:hypothetical protein
MKALLRLVFAALLSVSALGVHAQRAFEPGELESLLAPIALYPDPLLSQILDASRYPQDVAAAAAWMRANPQLSGDAALATVQGTTWAPSVKALVATPDVLERMAESPQWLHDLGEAYAYYGPGVMATVQDLRARAQASGYLQSNDQNYVIQQGEAIVVQPIYPNVVYAPWYDPYVVYGGWAWAHRPAYWRPWVARPHFLTRIIVAPPVRWHVHRPQQHFHRAPPPRIVQGGPTLRPYRPVPEARRPPFVHSGGGPIVHGGGAPIVRSAPALPQARLTPGHAASGGTTPLRRDGGNFSFRRDGGGHPGVRHGGPQGRLR